MHLPPRNQPEQSAARIKKSAPNLRRSRADFQVGSEMRYLGICGL
jgi:hypothetical protein